MVKAADVRHLDDRSDAGQLARSAFTRRKKAALDIY
jgi:hypothetical protein